jgi:hypothetical protein
LILFFAFPKGLILRIILTKIFKMYKHVWILIKIFLCFNLFKNTIKYFSKKYDYEVKQKSTTAKIKMTFVNSISGLTPPPTKGSIKAARDYLARPPSQTVQVGQHQGSQGVPDPPTQPDCTGRAASRQPGST